METRSRMPLKKSKNENVAEEGGKARGMSKLMRQVKNAVGVVTRSRSRKRPKGLVDITKTANNVKRTKLNKSGKAAKKASSTTTRVTRAAARKAARKPKADKKQKKTTKKKKTKAQLKAAQPVPAEELPVATAVCESDADLPVVEAEQMSVVPAPKEDNAASASAAEAAPEAEEADGAMAEDLDTETEDMPSYTDIDAPHCNDANYETEYVNDMYEYYTEVETRFMPRTDYMINVQTDINAQMRSILVDWLVEVAEEYRLLPETLHLCVNLIDRSLSLFRVSRSKLQLLGCACMLLASKYEEIYAPGVDEFVYISDNTYTSFEVLGMESQTLNALNFCLTVPTAHPFLTRFIKAAQASEKEKHLACYLCEVGLLSYTMIGFKPSVMAAASVYLARLTMSNEQPWTHTLQHYSGLMADDLRECCEALHKQHALQPAASLKAVREKYSGEKYMGVSMLAVLVKLPWSNAV